MLAILDTGPLLAAANPQDPMHLESSTILSRADIQFTVPEMVIAETSYLIGRTIGPVAEARFLAGLHNLEIESSHPTDWTRIAELVETYRDFPLGGTDASVVALAERLNTDLIVTLDQRHFRVITPKHVPTFRLLPE